MDGTWRVGRWTVDLSNGSLTAGVPPFRRRLCPDGRLMTVLGVFLHRPGELVTADEILERAWSDRIVSRDSVSTAIYELRRVLGDDAANPRYLRTEPRRGYRLIAPVRRAAGPAIRGRAIAAAVVVVFAIGTAMLDERLRPARGEPTLHIGPLRDSTRDVELKPLADAIDATLRSALIQTNPGRIATGNERVGDGLELEMQLVACDLGAALVVKLRDGALQRYRWSRTYPLTETAAGGTLVQAVARDVSALL